MHLPRVPVARIVRGSKMLLPWCLAKAVFKPRVEEGRQDKPLERLAFWRSVVGLLVMVVATSPWQPAQNVLWDAYLEVARAAFVSLFVGGCLMTCFTIFTKDRAAADRRENRVLVRLALAALTVFILPIASLIIFIYLAGTYENTVHESMVAWTFLLVIWLVVHALCVIYWMARTCMWSSIVHPILAPVGTAIATTVITAREILDGGNEDVPYPLWLGLILFGLATSLILAYAEFRRLWTTRKVTFHEEETAPDDEEVG